MPKYNVIYKSGNQQDVELTPNESNDLASMMTAYMNWLDETMVSASPGRVFKRAGTIIDMSDLASTHEGIPCVID